MHSIQGSSPYIIDKLCSLGILSMASHAVLMNEYMNFILASF